MPSTHCAKIACKEHHCLNLETNFHLFIWKFVFYQHLNCFDTHVYSFVNGIIILRNQRVHARNWHCTRLKITMCQRFGMDLHVFRITKLSSLPLCRFIKQGWRNATSTHWDLAMPWASHQKRKIVGCACAGNAGKVFPATDFKGNR